MDAIELIEDPAYTAMFPWTMACRFEITLRDGRTVTDAIGANLQKVTAEERRMLTQRRGASEVSGRILLAIDLAGVLLILAQRYIAAGALGGAIK